MTPAEITIVSLVYVATLLLAQRGAAFVFPDLQEVGFLVAVVVGSMLAGFLYYGRERRDPSKAVVFAVAAPMAVLALVVGQLTQLLWQPFLHPLISLPAAAFATLLLPFFLFRTGRSIVGEQNTGGAEAVGAAHVIMVTVLTAALVVAAGMIPAPGHSAVNLFPQTYPGLTVSLPDDWQIEEKSVAFSGGTVRLADPAGGDHFLSVRWADSDPVQSDEYVKGIAAAMNMEVRDRTPQIVGGHEGVTFYLESLDHNSRAAATIWNCTNDHRVIWVLTNLLAPKGTMLATHQKVVESVRCHTGEGKSTTQPDNVFPDFIAPPGYVRDPSKTSLLYLGPRRQTIVFDAAVPGRSPLVDAVVSPNMVATMLKSIGSLSSIDAAPQTMTARDLLGHERRVWSAVGAGRDGNRVQVEIMVWWCDRRDMTFVGTYATQGTHNPNEGINAMLPAVCHKE
jgi:hypothetical protein